MAINQTNSLLLPPADLAATAAGHGFTRGPAMITISPPAWAIAPPWARYVAMDSDGQWWWFERCPYQDDGGTGDRSTRWDSAEGRMECAEAQPYFPGWEASLRQRPDQEKVV